MNLPFSIVSAFETTWTDEGELGSQYAADAPSTRFPFRGGKT